MQITGICMPSLSLKLIENKIYSRVLRYKSFLETAPSFPVYVVYAALCDFPSLLLFLCSLDLRPPRQPL